MKWFQQLLETSYVRQLLERRPVMHEETLRFPSQLPYGRGLLAR